MKALAEKGVEKWILWGIPVLFAVGSAVHFAYGFSGRAFVVGLFFPINESVWEHLKLVLWPMVLWWCGGYFYFARRGKGVDAPAWFMGALEAELVAQSTILLLYYFVQGAFGFHALWLDIGMFFLGLVLGQLVGLWQYRRGCWLSWMAPLLLLAGMALFFVVMTLAPPELPLFLDANTGSRGIFEI